MSTTLIRTKAVLREARAALPGSVAVVMTMGALHAGHLSLVQHARSLADHVILTDFVNPLQFGPGEDFEAYPRQLDADLALVDGLADLVFAPSVEEMYPVLPPLVSVTANHASTILEGACRPGHFDGVVTVVTKLLMLTQPDIAVFGRKDAQQLAIVRRLVADLDMPVTIEAVDIQRSAEGLALSSRNAYLSAAGRERALVLSRTIRAVEDAAPSASAILRVLEETKAAREIDWDYAAAVDPLTFQEITPAHCGEALVVLAGRVESPRLLDATVVPVTQP